MTSKDILSLLPRRPSPLARRYALGIAAGLIVAISLVDWLLDVNISFGFLYLFPMLLIGVHLSRARIVMSAILCTGLTEIFDPFAWNNQYGIPRLILSFAAFMGIGLYGWLSTRSREATAEHLVAIEREIELRRGTEEQLEFLIANSPATILTVDYSGSISLANQAAHRLLGVDSGELHGQMVSRFFPALATVPPPSQGAPAFHTEMECMGRKENRESFLAHVWFSTYQTTSGPRLAAIVFDASETLRERAEIGLQQLLSGSNVVVSALFHEIRNVCGAIAAVHAKLKRDAALAEREDFVVLGSLVRSLGNMAETELEASRTPCESVNIHDVLEELRIIAEPLSQDQETTTVWDLPEILPLVWANRQALLQVFLNLVKNSLRAMEEREPRVLSIRATCDSDFVAVRLLDTGPGVRNPERLFEPFQPGAHSAGIGLYVARSFVRAFHGDLFFEQQDSGCCFVVLLSQVANDSIAE